jgi:hypothetical protein
MTGFRFPARLEIFLFATAVSITDLGPNQPPTNGYPWLFSRGQSGAGVELTTHLHLVPML